MRTSQSSRVGGRPTTRPGDRSRPGVGKRILVQEAEASAGTTAAPVTARGTGGGQVLPAAFRFCATKFGSNLGSNFVLRREVMNIKDPHVVMLEPFNEVTDGMVDEFEHLSR